jgi:Fe2+ transport system protein FeoA
MLNNLTLGKVYEISEISLGTPCLNCNSCIRMRLMEMGLTEGEKIRVEGKSHGLYRLSILSKKENLFTTLALREEEMERICVL